MDRKVIVRNAARELRGLIGCETGYGHDDFKGLGAWGPFVSIHVTRGRKKAGSSAVLKARASVIKLLRTFYENRRRVKLGSELILRNVGMLGDFLIVNQNSEVVSTFPREERAKISQDFYKEFKSLAAFLTRKKVR